MIQPHAKKLQLREKKQEIREHLKIMVGTSKRNSLAKAAYAESKKNTEKKENKQLVPKEGATTDKEKAEDRGSQAASNSQQRVATSTNLPLYCD